MKAKTANEPDWESFVGAMRAVLQQYLLGVRVELERKDPQDWANESHGDSGDRGHRQYEACVNQQRVRELETRQEDLEAALRRIEDGTYGICQSCGQPIEPERLEAVPETLYHVLDTPTPVRNGRFGRR